jgi:hypothetical protein
MSRLPPPISDYVTDTRSALDNSVRLAQVCLATHACTRSFLHWALVQFALVSVSGNGFFNVRCSMLWEAFRQADHAVTRPGRL